VAQTPAAQALKARLQATLREHEEAAASCETGLRKQRSTVAGFDARIADATATLARLKEELKVKREVVVASMLDGTPLDSFQARLLWFAVRCDSWHLLTRRGPLLRAGPFDRGRRACALGRAGAG
jgi:hypothetical protein